MRKHPIVEFIKYTTLLFLLITSMDPVAIGVLFIVSLLLTRCKLLVADIWVFSAIVVIDLFSSIDGVTFLAYHNYHIITLEALVYGVISGIKIATVINISWKFSRDVRSDKLVIVTSYLMPPLALLISMTVRNVRRYTIKIQEIYRVQVSLEEKVNIFRKAILAIRSLSILIDWSLDNGIETVMSMENRGYKSGKRTSYKPVSISIRDIIEVLIIIITAIVFMVTRPSINIIPEINIETSLANIVVLIIVTVYVVLEEVLESKSSKSNLQ